MIGSEEQNTNCNFSSLKSKLFKERTVEPQCNLQVAYINLTFCWQQLDNFYYRPIQNSVGLPTVGLEISISLHNFTSKSNSKLNVRIRK